jgi:hypothetical protein
VHVARPWRAAELAGLTIDQGLNLTQNLNQVQTD